MDTGMNSGLPPNGVAVSRCALFPLDLNILLEIPAEMNDFLGSL